jgi:hypothetical protein
MLRAEAHDAYGHFEFIPETPNPPQIRGFETWS